MAPNWVRLILPALVIGAIVALVLFIVLGAGVRSHVVIFLLWPGLKLGELMGTGYPVHDWHGSLVTVLVDTLVYGTAVFLILLLATKR
jgi:hypothetical protein